MSECKYCSFHAVNRKESYHAPSITDCPYCEIDRLKVELEQARQMIVDEVAQAKKDHKTIYDLKCQLAEARNIIDKTYEEHCGRDFMHLPLDEAVDAVLAEARQEVARECIEAFEAEHGILGLAFTLRQRYGLEEE